MKKGMSNRLPSGLQQVFSRLGCPGSWFSPWTRARTGRTEILKLFDENYPIRLVTFSRRIGKPLSVVAGLDHIRGDACVVIDADLQDPPELIEDMVKKWQEGFEVVIAKRVSRKGESYLYLKAAQTFYRLLEHISEVKVPRIRAIFVCSMPG